MLRMSILSGVLMSPVSWRPCSLLHPIRDNPYGTVVLFILLSPHTSERLFVVALHQHRQQIMIAILNLNTSAQQY